MQTGTFVSISRSKLGPAPDVQHRPLAVAYVDGKHVASCECGWVSGRRHTRDIAVDSLVAHITQIAS